jgi:hypothetical protein
MRMRSLAAFVGGAMMLALVAPVLSQSLADVAKKEEERRKTIPQPAKVYTNKDLKAVPPAPAPPPADAGAAPADAKAAEKPAGAGDKEPAKKDGSKDAPVKDKAYWADRQKALQDTLERDQTYADALQSRINALTADFVNRDDPAQRSVIERDRQKALAELNRLKQTIVDDKKAQTDFAEEARRAGVPPGWLR